MKKIALITGVTGQDGAYLAQFLLEKDYKVYGTFRRVSTPNFWRLEYLGVLKEIELIPFDLLDQSSISEAIDLASPNEVYNLAAQSYFKQRKIYTTCFWNTQNSIFLNKFEHHLSTKILFLPLDMDLDIKEIRNGFLLF